MKVRRERALAHITVLPRNAKTKIYHLHCYVCFFSCVPNKMKYMYQKLSSKECSRVYEKCQ